MNRIKTAIVAGFVLITGAGITAPANAQSPGLADWIYYDIGGSAASHGAGGYRDYLLIDASADITLGLSCGEFSLTDNLEQLFDSFENAADNAVEMLISYVENVVASLPLIILQQAWPELVETYEDLMARYEEIIRISIRNCQETERVILEGENPWNDWVKISRGRKWQVGQENGETATDTDEDVAIGDAPEDIIWIEERKAGVSKPIPLVEDLIKYGYQQLKSPDARLKAIWPTQKEAVEFAHRVVGEMKIDFARPPASSPGEGVLPAMEENREEVAKLLKKAVTADGATFEEIRAMSSPAVNITPGIIQKLRAYDEGTRLFFINRLASEIATANAAERLLLTRRLLMTAVREPHVMVTPAYETVKNDLLPELDAEYRYLTDIAQMNQTFVSNTTTAILKDHESRKLRSTIFTGSPDGDLSSEGIQLK